MKTHIPSIFFFLVVLLTKAAAATECSNVFIGDYATAERKSAVLRIERIDGKIVSRERNADGNWAPHFDHTHLLMPFELEKLFGDIPLAKKCGLMVVGVGVLLKLPIGTKYQSSSVTEKSYVIQQVTTGFLAYAAQGFAVSGVDLYIVPHERESPPAPPKAVVGKEVPVTAASPGKRLPDMPQAALDPIGVPSA